MTSHGARPRSTACSPRPRPRFATSAAAGRWSRFPVASIRASSRRSAPGRSGRNGCCACACPSATWATRPRISALELAEALGTPTVEEPITDALEGLGCYRRRDEAIREVFPDYQPDWRHKIVRSAPSGGITFFSLVVERPDGTTEERRMPPGPYRQILAATNMKQRTRKLMEYTWADKLGYAVAGTPNLLEYDQGFFVKGGDGLADLKPIAGLYKSQVYALARDMGLPASITERMPTTETFSLPQTQEEFYFGHPYERMDLLMWGQINAIPGAELAPRVGLAEAEVTAAYGEIERRRVATEYLHAPAALID